MWLHIQGQLSKMVLKYLSLVLVIIALKSTTALICHDFVCDATNCYGEGTTCDSGNNPCQVLKASHYGAETTTFTCSVFESCQSYLANNTFDGMIVSTCCNTDYCNDHLGGEPMERNKQYCYNLGCEGDGCAMKMGDYVDNNNIGAYCEASEHGCELTRLMQRHPETGEMLVEESSVCASSPCFPLHQELDGMSITIDCCVGNLCNKDHNTEDANKDYCYSYTCAEPPCMTIQEAAKKGFAMLCEMGPKGCYFSNTTSTMDNRNVVMSGCVDMAPQLGEHCVPSSLNLDGIQTTMKCCDTNKCNDGRPENDNTQLDPNKNYCHVYECVSASCWPLADAVKLGRTTVCEMTALGCYANSIHTLEGTIIDAGCVGYSPTFQQCVPMNTNLEGKQTTTICCNSDRCNDKINDGQVNNVLDPNKDYCHVYSCMGSSAEQCKPLAEAVTLGEISYCEMSHKGCFESEFMTRGQYSFLSGCAGDVGMVQQCEQAAFFSDDIATIQKCCDTDRCNDGELMAADADLKPFCHVYHCETTSGSCMKLADAIIMKKTVKCERKAGGCFVASSDERITTGCIGEEYGLPVCPDAPAGGSVSCCNTDGCNDGLQQPEPEDDNTPDNNESGENNDDGDNNAATAKTFDMLLLFTLLSACVFFNY